LLIAARKAAQRALCLAAIVTRAEFEYRILERPSEKPQRQAEQQRHSDEINAWLKEESLWKELSRRERELLTRPLGSWSPQEIADGQWRKEALCALVWALGRLRPLPRFDEPADAKELLDAIEFMKPADALVLRPKLLPESEISGARNVAELWLWRARTYHFQRNPQKYPPPSGMSYHDLIRQVADMAEEKGLFRAIEHDFPVAGQPYATLNDDKVSELQSIASERLYALNWLCNYSENWDAVPTLTQAV
jgi:hypothetical protein